MITGVCDQGMYLASRASADPTALWIKSFGQMLVVGFPKLTQVMSYPKKNHGSRWYESG